MAVTISHAADPLPLDSFEYVLADFSFTLLDPNILVCGSNNSVFNCGIVSNIANK